jgi:hypothetical protein
LMGLNFSVRAISQAHGKVAGALNLETAVRRCRSLKRPALTR